MNDELYVRIRDRWEGTHSLRGVPVTVPTVIPGTLDDRLIRIAVEEAAEFYGRVP